MDANTYLLGLAVIGIATLIVKQFFPMLRDCLPEIKRSSCCGGEIEMRDHKHSPKAPPKSTNNEPNESV